MDPPLSRAALICQNGCGILGSHAPGGGQSDAQTIRVLGIGIVKRVCHVAGLDDTGHVALRKRLARCAWRHFVSMFPPAPHGDGSVRECPPLGSMVPRIWA
jgi:hypothetical protein